MLAGPKEKHVAVISEVSHIPCSLIAQENLNGTYRSLMTRCHYLYREFLVEKSNYNAVLRSLDELNNLNTSIVICAIFVTGKLSGTDISRIIDRSTGIHESECSNSLKGGSLRLLMISYPQLLYALHMTGLYLLFLSSHSAGRLRSVIVSKAAVQFKESKPQLYSDVPLLHSIYLVSHERFSKFPRQLKLTHFASLLQDINRAQMSWKQSEHEWRLKQKKPQIGDTTVEGIYRLLVAPDPSVVQKYYVSKPNVGVIDCR
jgi:hypothetical protein